MSLTKPVAVTLFSGVGGSSLALRNLGYFVIAHDFAPNAVKSLKANGFIARECDVKTVDWTLPQYAHVEILEGGPPCQPFSQSHDGDGQYDPRDMIPEFLRAIDGLQPKVFVMEEVQTLTWKKHADYFARVISDMEALGYVVEYKVLDSSKYGIAQKRKRLIVIGVRADIAAERTAQAEWFTSLGYEGVVSPVMWPAESDEVITMADRLGWDEFEASIRNLAVPDPRAHVVSHNDPLDPRLNWVYDRPAPTVVGSFRPEVAAAPGYRKAGDPPRQATPGSVVTTLAERLALQDFPADWIVVGPKASQDLQVGNSVPVGFMQAVIDANIP